MESDSENRRQVHTLLESLIKLRQAIVDTKYSLPASYSMEVKTIDKCLGNLSTGGSMKNVIAILHGLFVCPCSHNK